MDWIMDKMVEEATNKSEHETKVQHLTEPLFEKLRDLPKTKVSLVLSKDGKALGVKTTSITWFPEKYLRMVYASHKKKVQNEGARY